MYLYIGILVYTFRHMQSSWVMAMEFQLVHFILTFCVVDMQHYCEIMARAKIKLRWLMTVRHRTIQSNQKLMQIVLNILQSLSFIVSFMFVLEFCISSATFLIFQFDGNNILLALLFCLMNSVLRFYLLMIQILYNYFSEYNSYIVCYTNE